MQKIKRFWTLLAVWMLCLHPFCVKGYCEDNDYFCSEERTCCAYDESSQLVRVMPYVPIVLLIGTAIILHQSDRPGSSTTSKDSCCNNHAGIKWNSPSTGERQYGSATISHF